MDFEAFLRKWQNDPSTSSQIERLVPMASGTRRPHMAMAIAVSRGNCSLA